MGKHRRAPHAVMRVPTAAAEALTQASQNESLGRAARGIAVLALVVGSLGAEAAAASGHGGHDHVGAAQPVGTSHIGGSYQLTSSGGISHRPWMY